MNKQKNKKALIFGISGQDGSYLAKLLLKKGYKVFGTSRDAQMVSLRNLEILGIRHNISMHSMSVNDFRSILQVFSDVEPDEVYNLAGQTSVGRSFAQPAETMESISSATLNVLEALRFYGGSVKYYNASSSECFGDTAGKAADEKTAFKPRSPYAVAKASAHWLVDNYREAYNLFACNGILFNHESPLRPSRFVTKKIVSGACRIKHGIDDKLELGNLNINRDWGWAPEYVEAMWLMLQQKKAEDYVIATGVTSSLQYFVEIVFKALNLNWQDHIVVNKTLLCRPTDILISKGNPQKANNKLKWRAKYKLSEIINFMIEYELNSIKSSIPK